MGLLLLLDSIRENLEIARRLYPNDTKLQQLEREECNTDNLSPWPGVASAAEKMNHDEFMRRFCNSLRSPTSGARVSKTSSFLRAERWNGPLLQAFKHFVAEHVSFDSDPDQGHGALSRHLKPDDRILPLGGIQAASPSGGPHIGDPRQGSRAPADLN